MQFAFFIFLSKNPAVIFEQLLLINAISNYIYVYAVIRVTDIRDTNIRDTDMRDTRI